MIDIKYHTKLSKFLSLVLRHKPEKIGIELGSNGGTDVNVLIEKMNSFGKQIDFETLEVILETNNKKRFSFNKDKSLIRANQGHSIEVDLGYKTKIPPGRLFHGTEAKYVESIYQTGIRKKNRHHVHLSKDVETAISVGQRHGKPVVFEILTEEMINEGFEFYESENGVWLTDEIPVRFIRKIEE
jgi:putative RNA 2'-phosphotransferase